MWNLKNELNYWECYIGSGVVEVTGISLNFSNIHKPLDTIRRL